MSGEDGKLDNKAEIPEALSDPINMKILQLLSRTNLWFSDIRRETGIENNEILLAHLERLDGLLKNTYGNYQITEKGLEALRTAPTEPKKQKMAKKLPRLSRKNAIIAMALIATVAISLAMLTSLPIRHTQQIYSYGAGNVPALNLNPDVPFGVVTWNSFSVPKGSTNAYVRLQLSLISDNASQVEVILSNQTALPSNEVSTGPIFGPTVYENIGASTSSYIPLSPGEYALRVEVDFSMPNDTNQTVNITQSEGLLDMSATLYYVSPFIVLSLQ